MATGGELARSYSTILSLLPYIRPQRTLRVIGTHPMPSDCRVTCGRDAVTRRPCNHVMCSRRWIRWPPLWFERFVLARYKKEPVRACVHDALAFVMCRVKQFQCLLRSSKARCSRQPFSRCREKECGARKWSSLRARQLVRLDLETGMFSIFIYLFSRRARFSSYEQRMCRFRERCNCSQSGIVRSYFGEHQKRKWFNVRISEEETGKFSPHLFSYSR